MKKFLLGALAVLALLPLTACGGDQGTITTTMLEEERTAVDPSDSVLDAAVHQYLASTGGPASSQYEYTRKDLNGDGLREGIVIFNLPHNYWCGWSGCTMAVFQAGDESFKLLSKTSRVRGPLVVADTKTNGWDDIGLRLSGTDTADRNVLLKFNGAAYPENPLTEASLPFDLASLGGTRVLP